MYMVNILVFSKNIKSYIARILFEAKTAHKLTKKMLTHFKPKVLKLFKPIKPFFGQTIYENIFSKHQFSKSKHKNVFL